MERLHISYGEALETPNAAVERAFIIWSMDNARAKLEAATQKT